MPAVHPQLYIALVNAGVSAEEAAEISSSDRTDLTGALIATLRKLTQVLQLLDALEDMAALNLGVVRTKRFAPPREESK
jgi:hypothetical protein